MLSLCRSAAVAACRFQSVPHRTIPSLQRCLFRGTHGQAMHDVRFYSSIPTPQKPAEAGTTPDNPPSTVDAERQAVIPRGAAVQMDSAFEAENWKPIYRNPHIVKVVMVLRAKLYHTFMLGAYFPIATILYSYEIIDTGSLMLTGGLMLFAVLVLQLMTKTVGNTIGFIYVNDRKDLVRIAHMTNFGERRDIIINKEDVVPFSDVAMNMKAPILQVYLYSKPRDCLYLPLVMGGVEDVEEFEDIFRVKMRMPVERTT